MSVDSEIKNLKLKRTWKKTPTVFQMENVECGAASLAMILAYYKCYVPLEKLRIECGVSKDGCNAFNVANAAVKYGFKFEALKYDLEDLIAETNPCIIHWNFNHFVVYEGIKHGYIYINDPATGRRKISLEELNKSFTGIVLKFEKTEKAASSKKSKSVLDFLKKRSKNQKLPLLIMLLLGLILVVPGMISASFSRIFIDEILTSRNYDWFFPFLFVMLSTVIFQFIFSFIRNVLVNKFQLKLSIVYGYDFLERMLKLPISFYDQRYAGDLSQRIVNNDTANTFLSGRLVAIVLDFITAIFYLIFMFFYNVSLTIISVIGLSISMIATFWLASKVNDDNVKYMQDNGKMTGQLFSGIEISSTIKACGLEDRFVHKLLGLYSAMGSLEQKIGRVTQLIAFAPSTLLQITNICILMFGAVMVIDSQITMGMLSSFAVIFAAFIAPVNSLFGVFQELQSLRANLLRVQDIENYKISNRFLSKSVSSTDIDLKLSGKIDIENLTFGYSPVDKPFFKDLSFSIKPGEVVALVGPSGCGKSSILKLLSGLYLPWEGKILFDNKLAQEYPTNVLTTSLSTISQDIMMVSDTIKNNMTLWNNLTIEEDIVHAAKDACIHETISKFSQGYNYKLSQGAKNLSGGQRQRLEIARALVNNPSILLMDEATSALDPIVENQVMSNIKKRGCTCVIVAHRLSTIRDADKIICIDNGKIVQIGTHDILKNQDGMYKKLITNL